METMEGIEIVIVWASDESSDLSDVTADETTEIAFQSLAN
jgi:hypothetical protein